MVLGEVDVSTDSASALQKVQWLARATASGSTFSSVKLKGVPAAQVAQALANIGPVDGYVLNAVQFAGAFEELFADKPFIFVAHNVEHRSAQENAAAARSPLQRMLYRREARLLEALEARLCERARYVFTLAEEDRAMLGVAGDARSAALPLVTGAVPSRPADRAVECDAALVGTWTWQPNRIGLDWFLEQVVPRLAPSFRIRIAGRTPADVASPHPGVEFVGRVPDAVAFMRSAAVVPLIARAGTGGQLKTSEPFGLGRPAVATSSSLRGVDYFPQNCTVADEPEAFARALQHMAASRRRSRRNRVPMHSSWRSTHGSAPDWTDCAHRAGNSPHDPSHPPRTGSVDPRYSGHGRRQHDAQRGVAHALASSSDANSPRSGFSTRTMPTSPRPTRNSPPHWSIS